MGEKSKVKEIKNESTMKKETDYRPKEYKTIGRWDEDKKRLLYPVSFSSSSRLDGDPHEYNGSGGFPPREWYFSFSGIDLENDEGVEFYGDAYEGFAEIRDIVPWFFKHNILFSSKTIIANVTTGDDIPSYNETKEVYNEFKKQNLSEDEITQKMIEWSKEQESKKRR